MLKISLVLGFLLSLATLSLASSLVPAPLATAPSEPHPWIVTYE